MRDEFFIGQEVIVKSTITYHPEARYRGRIIDITPHCIIFEGTVMQNEMNEKSMVLGRPKPVRYGFKKCDLLIDNGTKIFTVQ